MPNSGAAGGSAAKRITVRKHVCSWSVVRTAGRSAEGDGGGGLYRFVTASAPEVNGGTVLAGKGAVWVLEHDGVVDFRVFGVFGPQQNADDALTAMVADESIRRFEDHTDLNFVRR